MLEVREGESGDESGMGDDEDVTAIHHRGRYYVMTLTPLPVEEGRAASSESGHLVPYLLDTMSSVRCPCEVPREIRRRGVRQTAP